MKRKIGIIYSSVDGQTLKICKELSTFFNEEQIQTELCSIDSFQGDLSEFHTLIIGASIRYGKHNKKISEFVQNNKEHLNEMRTAFFSVNLVARKEDKNSPDTNPYLIKFLQKTNWKPDFVGVFAGKLDYKSYSLFDSLMIKLIMKLTDGPTKSENPIEFTNWKKVKAFGLRILEDYPGNKNS
ncbi:menaquinone-dependent protoporphyrinogen oxidase [Salegentibacter holothuriorum]|uniref:Protoporphyrinogen IX dehydrogenase [quinone] n=1 Tax=Salegentibacter holothuriorum TaxID=241145 RepID=A0A1T5EEF1_9FLAO|nr:menaquinone-dependent protoporphyrinogen IX dehydrogenase [Salegentibacter holothuriorum]SKB82130.1 menaquinone-dependent protoporphyrinogen oxidase [Salegentibacter holothuriorum]